MIITDTSFTSVLYGALPSVSLLNRQHSCVESLCCMAYGVCVPPRSVAERAPKHSVYRQGYHLCLKQNVFVGRPFLKYINPGLVLPSVETKPIQPDSSHCTTPNSRSVCFYFPLKVFDTSHFERG